jgi:hypothetical protein
MIVNLIMLVTMLGIVITLVMILYSIIRMIEAMQYLSSRIDLKAFTENLRQMGVN